MTKIPSAVRDKGQRLIDSGNVTCVKGLAFTVVGSTGLKYNVWLSYPAEASGRCDCPSIAVICPHIFAASVWHLANPEPVKEKSDLDPFRGLGV